MNKAGDFGTFEIIETSEVFLFDIYYDNKGIMD